MSKVRKQRSDSISGSVRIGFDLQNATQELTWPKAVPPAEDPERRDIEISIFDSIIVTRLPNQWTPFDILTAARLSSHMTVVLMDEDTLRKSGSLIRSPKNPKHFLTNPLLNAVFTRSNLINTMSRHLGLTIPQSDLMVQKNQAKTAKSMQKGDDNVFHLLAQPR